MSDGSVQGIDVRHDPGTAWREALPVAPTSASPRPESGQLPRLDALPGEAMATWIWLIGITMAVVFGVCNVFLAFNAGITPNMALAGAFIAAVFLRRSRRHPDAASIARSMNLLETISTAGNAGAVALAFTVPVIFIRSSGPPGLSWQAIGLALGSAAGGISAAFLLVVFLLESTPDLKLRDDNANEAAGILSLIRGLSDKLAAGRSVLQGALLFGLAVGVVSGLLKGGVERAFTATLPIGGLPLEVGWDPALIALGGMIGLGTARGLAGGSILAIVIAFAPIAFNAQVVSASQTKPIAAIVLGLACIKALLVFFRQGAAARPAESRWRLGFAGLRRNYGVLALPLAALTALGLGILGVLASQGAPGPLVVIGLAVILTVVAVVLAERIVTLTGVTLNPTSGLALLAGGLLAAVWKVRDPLLLTSVCAFVVGAGSAGASLSQDLLIGDALGTGRRRQAASKWWGSIVAVAVVALVVHSLDLTHLPIPQGKSLDELTTLLANSASHGKPVLVLAGLIFACCLVIKIDPLITAVGLLVPPSISLPLLAGGFLMHRVSRRFRLDEPDRLPVRATVLASFAVILGGYGVFSAACALGVHFFHLSAAAGSPLWKLVTLLVASAVPWVVLKAVDRDVE